MPKEPIHNKKFDPFRGKFIPRKRTYTVGLVSSDDNEWKMFHCPDCRSYIAQYNGEAVCEIPGEAPEALPVKIQCRNPNCGRKIVFMYAAEQVI